MLIYVKNIKKKTFYGRTDGQTDGRTTQNDSSEPHKTVEKKVLLLNQVLSVLKMK